MTFCRKFSQLPERGGFLDQPADVMVRWQDYIDAENEALELRRKLDEARAASKR
jgi:hypothetical protein